MTVEDHVVHVSTIKTGHHEHCWNNRHATCDQYIAQDGWNADGTRRTVLIDNEFSKLCRQPGANPPLPGCVGCQHLGEDVEFEERMKKAKNEGK